MGCDAWGLASSKSITHRQGYPKRPFEGRFHRSVRALPVETPNSSQYAPQMPLRNSSTFLVGLELLTSLHTVTPHMKIRHIFRCKWSVRTGFGLLQTPYLTEGLRPSCILVEQTDGLTVVPRTQTQNLSR